MAVDLSHSTMATISDNTVSQMMAIDPSQSTMTALSDNTVSRMMAEKALFNQDYKELLLEYISLPIPTGPLREEDKKFEPLFKSITDFREDLADEAMLEAPKDTFGRKRELNTYLKQVQISRTLVPNWRAQREGIAQVVAKRGKNEWGWVVSRQVYLTDLAS